MVGIEAVILEVPVGTIRKSVAVKERNIGMNLGVRSGELDNDTTMTAEDNCMTEIDIDKNRSIAEDMEERKLEMNLLPCKNLVHTIFSLNLFFYFNH